MVFHHIWFCLANKLPGILLLYAMGSWIKFKLSVKQQCAIKIRHYLLFASVWIPLHWILFTMGLWCVCNDLIEIPNANSLFENCTVCALKCADKKECLSDYLFEVKLSHDKSKSCIRGFVFQRRLGIAQFLYATQPYFDRHLQIQSA